jgi:hypothetical protein
VSRLISAAEADIARDSRPRAATSMGSWPHVGR